MNILGLDVGSSSVKAGIVRGGRIIGPLVHASYPTYFDGIRAEVGPANVLKAITHAISQLGPAARRVEAIGLSVMSPAWIAMDRAGKPLTPIVTHQDRRSVRIAHELENRVGKQQFLRIAGNLPFPGGISITTLAWYVKNQPEVIRNADLIGHLNTFLHRQMTGKRVIDPSNASFTGLYETVKLGTWSHELCKAAGVSISKLPDIFESNQVPGTITPQSARRFGLTEGTPVMAGMIDTSAALMLFGAGAGQLLNVSGSTDVLGLCTNRPRPHEKLLTRAVGVGRLWLSVGTLAAAGSSIVWAREQLFRDLSADDFYRLVAKLARKPEKSADAPTVVFEPYLAGERTSIDQKRASFSNLTLATTRQDMLEAIIDALAKASGARLGLLKSRGVRIRPTVFTSGGTAHALHKILYRDWPGRWRFKSEREASLRGLSRIMPRPL
ncbi:MAG TPA: FGGY family carbohydrate kinase [Tepidisphaeraceae bacterium]|jgi:sugar (pentulose or hexulose) kinase|nr:FGGY family carbohydrate kinase [Tepidisphaeraceae bacterium]